MELEFLDENFKILKIVDSFKSLIWTERFWEHGDFDFVCSPSLDILSILPATKYFNLGGVTRDEEYRMILETDRIASDVEDGDSLVLQGRSLESILDRRRVHEITTLSGDLQTTILSLLDDTLISPTDPNRYIPGITLTTNSNIPSITINTTFQGDSVYDILSFLCQSHGVGFRLRWNESTSDMRFELLHAVDRSYDQIDVPYVAFTTKLNNLLNANYVHSTVPLRNVCYVAGEAGIGNIRTVVEVGSASGLARREEFLEASINRNSGEEEMTDLEYISALEEKGTEELARRIPLVAFDGEVDTGMYNYGDDFSIGDILQIADDYGHQVKSRVVEVIYSQNSEGIKIYPTFKTVE